MHDKHDTHEAPKYDYMRLTFDNIQRSHGSMCQSAAEDSSNGAVAIVLAGEEGNLPLLIGCWNHEILTSLHHQPQSLRPFALVLKYK